MRRAPTLWVALVALVALSGCAGGPPARPAAVAPPMCVEAPPCVYVSPDPAEARPGALLTYRGIGWERGREIETTHGIYCSPPSELPTGPLGGPEPTYGCPAIGISETFRVDRHGEFRYRFAQAPKAPIGVPGAVGFGGGPVVFSQREGEPGDYAHLYVDAIPVGRPGSPGERHEARRVARVLRLTRRAVDRKPNLVPRASIREYRTGSCNSRRPASGRVGRVSLDLALETGNGILYSLVQPDLERFVGALQSLATRDPELRAGAAAWARQVRARSGPNRCAVVPRWTGTHFEWSRRPIGPAALGLGEAVLVDPAIRRGARRMRQLGAGPRAQKLFAGDVIGVEPSGGISG